MTKVVIPRQGIAYTTGSFITPRLFYHVHTDSNGRREILGIGESVYLLSSPRDSMTAGRDGGDLGSEAGGCVFGR